MRWETEGRKPRPRTQKLLLFSHEVLHETARKDQIMNLLWCAGEHGLHRDFIVMTSVLPALTPCDFWRLSLTSFSARRLVAAEAVRPGAFHPSPTGFNGIERGSQASASVARNVCT